MLINRYPDNWQSALDKQLETLRAQFPTAHVYALIEGVFNDACYAFLKRSKRLPYYALYESTSNADEETLSISPLLVEYQPDGRKAWNDLLKKTNGHPALSLIITPEPLNDLARRLLPWCIINANSYTLALSFADTRILPELFKALTPDQLGQICGPALHWQYVTRTAAWETLPLPRNSLPPADDVELDERQCAQLTDAAEADNILFQLRTTAAALVDCHTPARAHDLVRHWLACADHAQLQAAPERTSLCEWGLRHPGLEAHAQVTQWLEMPAESQTLEALPHLWKTGSAL